MTEEETIKERLVTAWKDGYRLGAAASGKLLIKLEAWVDHSGQLGWHTMDSILNEYIDDRWRRVPSEDKWVEVEE